MGGPEESIVNGAGGTQVFRIRADNVEINGFEIYGTTADLVTSDGLGGNGGDFGAILRYNIAHGAGDDALVLYKHSDGLIEYNRIYATNDGINLAGADTISPSPASHDNTVRYNEVSGGYGNGGIYVYDSANTTIEGNYAAGPSRTTSSKARARMASTSSSLMLW
jgi:parallel beta-helix repeat protein